jgi:DNA primase
MVNQLLISLANSVLGSGKRTARGNMAYTCPYCNHHKPKLEVNFTENKEGHNPWHCWVCNKKGKSLYILLKQAGASKDKLDEVNSLCKSNYNKVYTEKVVNTLKLPKEYIPLFPDDKTITWKQAYYYLKSRGITDDDILKYNIGYCEYGLYANMIIIPTYDADGRLNYFTARSFDKNAYIKYRNPQVSRDIIPNEHMINWKVPIVICEGLFDAIAIKRNAIPLLGKNIQSELMKKIVSSFVQKVYIALDKDAIKQALHFCEQLMMEGKEVYFVDLQDKDPSEMGFKNFTNLIQNTVPMTYSTLLERKLSV